MNNNNNNIAKGDAPLCYVYTVIPSMLSTAAYIEVIQGEQKHSTWHIASRTWVSEVEEKLFEDLYLRYC
jgi:hypothetical protein